jgi:S-ribosylhomocysteine lyase LuxS involved in autoinducer biosynthesis
MANEYKHIFFMGDYVKLNSFLDLAGNYKITVNDAYLARPNSKMINDNKQREAEHLISSGTRDDMIYIFQDIESASKFKESGIHFFIIDDVIIGIDAKKT